MFWMSQQGLLVLARVLHCRWCQAGHKPTSYCCAARHQAHAVLCPVALVCNCQGHTCRTIHPGTWLKPARFAGLTCLQGKCDKSSHLARLRSAYQRPGTCQAAHILVALVFSAEWRVWQEALLGFWHAVVQLWCLELAAIC
ncbi:hypothetical protein COO60DRAFT_286949 [Scenedesmus sp. NREL 46B-D3]|nr:hypothetical protein COO60DRAFT_286949 [Scenedesmus sp. NREL 46B-D3]